MTAAASGRMAQERLAERIRKALSGRGAVAERRMMGAWCFLVDGHMVCGALDDGLMVRVPPEAGAALLGRADVTPLRQGKRTMRGFVRVAAAGARTAPALERWLALALAYTRTLPRKGERADKTQASDGKSGARPSARRGSSVRPAHR